ncbi:MAG: lysophospholipid acyltransferase family protein [Planctomycetales bacterium]
MKIRNPFLIKAAATIVAQPFIWLSHMADIRVFCEEPHINMTEADCGRQYLYALWHDEILLPVLRCARGGETLSQRRISALVSKHQDGSILSDFMNLFHIDAIRGSTSRGGAEALRQLIEEAQGRSIFITPDGPRGPRHVLKPGIIFLASQTGIPIVPIASVCPHSWDLKGNWTSLIVPKPFAKITILLGSPITIPPDLSREALEEQRLHVEREMERVQQKLQTIVDDGSRSAAKFQLHHYRAA